MILLSEVNIELHRNRQLTLRKYFDRERGIEGHVYAVEPNKEVKVVLVLQASGGKVIAQDRKLQLFEDYSAIVLPWIDGFEGDKALIKEIENRGLKPKEDPVYTGRLFISPRIYQEYLVYSCKVKGKVKKPYKAMASDDILMSSDAVSVAALSKVMFEEKNKKKANKTQEINEGQPL